MKTLLNITAASELIFTVGVSQSVQATPSQAQIIPVRGGGHFSGGHPGGHMGESHAEHHGGYEYHRAYGYHGDYGHYGHNSGGYYDPGNIYIEQNKDNNLDNWPYTSD